MSTVKAGRQWWCWGCWLWRHSRWSSGADSWRTRGSSTRPIRRNERLRVATKGSYLIILDDVIDCESSVMKSYAMKKDFKFDEAGRFIYDLWRFESSSLGKLPKACSFVFSILLIIPNWMSLTSFQILAHIYYLHSFHSLKSPKPNFCLFYYWYCL